MKDRINMKQAILNKKHLPIYTERLRLDTISIEQTNEILEIYSNNDLLKYTDSNYITTTHQAKEIIDHFENQYRAGSGLYLGINKLKNNCLIGIISIHDINYKHFFCSCSFILKKECWNQGIMTEAAHSFFSSVFNHTLINRIEAQVFTDNKNSIKMLNKLKMQREGRLRKNFLIADVFEDSYIYSLLKNEYI